MKNALLAALALVLTALPAAAQPLCDETVINQKGSSNADVTVDSTAGGVRVMDASTTRCCALIHNSGEGDMRCAPTSLVVTTTKGALVPSGQSLVLGIEGREAWNCIRTADTSTTANVVECAQ